MRREPSQLRADALRIWHAGLNAVRSERLMKEHVRFDGRVLSIDDGSSHSQQIDLANVQRMAVVGAGKAGAGMAAAFEEILGTDLIAEKQLVGWVNVPADCVNGHGGRIHLHAARPAGVNEPTPEGAAGADEILRIVSSLGPDDLCIALISGGGSALLPAPIEKISLADKLAVTRFLSAAGADITELNTVRKHLSRIKGGGLAHACRAGQLIALVISDIPGDPLELISSGPTVTDPSTPQEALMILERFGAREGGVPAAVFEALNRKVASGVDPPPIRCQVSNFVIGNNAAAVDAAGQEAVRLGYTPAMNCAQKPEGLVEPIGRHLAEIALFMRSNSGPNCLISGGEGTVKLAPPEERGLGGRNQQTVLAALVQLSHSDPRGIVILSGGTDGEDGPTDAAGALVDAAIIDDAKRRGLQPIDSLNRNDAYHFFEPLGGLIKTGPTNTNVCDLRVVLVDPA